MRFGADLAACDPRDAGGPEQARISTLRGNTAAACLLLDSDCPCIVVAVSSRYLRVNHTRPAGLLGAREGGEAFECR